nr:MAG TPA: hypothetical protein [Inoviridae sp.]
MYILQRYNTISSAVIWNFVNAIPPRLKWQQDLSRLVWPKQSNVGQLKRIKSMILNLKVFLVLFFIMIILLIYFYWPRDYP